MPARSTVLNLPPALRLELDGRIIEAGFGGYRGHVAWLAGEGHGVSESALQRYGASLRRQLPAPLARIRLNSALRARVRTETAGRPPGELTATALDLAEEALQEYLHARLESGEMFDRDELVTLFAIMANDARARGALARVQRSEAGADRKARARGVSPDGEAAIRAAVEGAAE